MHGEMPAFVRMVDCMNRSIGYLCMNGGALVTFECMETLVTFECDGETLVTFECDSETLVTFECIVTLVAFECEIGGLCINYDIGNL